MWINCTMKKLLTITVFFTVSFLFGQTDPGKYSIKNVDVNTKLSDFGTAFFGKDKVIFAAPKEGAVLTRLKWGGNDQPFLDLYIGDINENGEIVNKKRIPGDVNTKYHEGVVSFTKDKKTVYYSANDYQRRKFRTDSTGTNNIQLFKASVTSKGEWVNIKKLPFNDLSFSTGHPTLNHDDTKLYFISDRPESIGKTDIYVVDINENGTYSEPRNLGPKINTVEREMFPFISDDDILYFSSNGRDEGLGELDVFASKIFDTTVADPISLGEPVNSKKDDFAYIIDDTKNKGYFSSNRKEGKGDDDIYMLTASPPIHFDCDQLISGVVRDKETEELLPGTLVVLNDKDGNKINEVVVSEDASFSFELPCDTDFTLVGTQPGFLRQEIPSKTANDLDVDPMEMFLDLAPELKVVDEKIMININTIYFDFDKAVIRPEAAAELDKVVAVMKEHPSMIIEAGSHTDSRAREAYNQILSEKRARATVDYIVSKGIDRNRISARGYGEMQLVNNCSSFVKCSRQEHQLNRRTEFVIVNDDARFTSANADVASVKIDNRINMTYVDIKGSKVSNPEPITTVSEPSIEPTATAVESSANQGRYRIVIGAYKKRSNANRKLDKLKKQGYQAEILTMQDGLMQVIAGSYDLRDEAQSALIEIQKKIEKKAWILEYSRNDAQVNQNKVISSAEAPYLNDKRPIKKIKPIYVPNDGSVVKKVTKEYIKFDPIYYAYDNWSLSSKELIKLGEVVRVLNENKELVVEIQVHTDAKNTEKHNQLLSDKRARSIASYMASRKVSPDQVYVKGFGEQILANRCKSFTKCSEEEHQANRRIEFIVVEGNGYPEQNFLDKQNEKYINTNPIYFNYDKVDIRKDAAYELNRVAEILKVNTDLIIEAGSHTDSNNTEAYNQVLSEKRANSVKAYLVSKGIPENRIKSKGYGEMQLVNNCSSFVKCTAEQHQQNRRTEFKIIESQ